VLASLHHLLLHRAHGRHHSVLLLLLLLLPVAW
jgi:hypothetical protein